MLILFASAASAGPLPLVTVHPLPANSPISLEAGFSKAQLIAAASRQTTVEYYPLATLERESVAWAALPAAFSCTVVNRVLTVSYLREGFVTDGLPGTGSCTEGKDVVRFRIKIEHPSKGT